MALSAATGIDNAADILGGVQTRAATTSEAFLLTPALPGDANLDGQVDVNDLTIVLGTWPDTAWLGTPGEFNGDGTVDVNDLTIVLANYGQMPEPLPPTRLRCPNRWPCCCRPRRGRPRHLRVAEAEIGIRATSSCGAVESAHATAETAAPHNHGVIPGR